MSTRAMIAVKWKETRRYEVFYRHCDGSPQSLGVELACGVGDAVPVCKILNSLKDSLEKTGVFVDGVADIFPAMQKDLEWIYALEEAPDPAQTRLTVFGTSLLPGFEFTWPVWFSQACHLPDEEDIEQIMEDLFNMKDEAGIHNRLHTQRSFDFLLHCESQMFVGNLRWCISRCPLGERQGALIELLKWVLPVLDEEIRQVSPENLQTILTLQEQCPQAAGGDRTFIRGGPDGSETMFSVVLGQTVDANARPAPFGFVFRPGALFNWAYNGTFLSDDVRRLNDEGVREAAWRLSQMIILLDKTFDDPGGTIRRLAGEIRKAEELAGNC